MVKKASIKREVTLERTWPYILTIGGLVGFIAAFVLTIEKFSLLKDPSYNPSCNLSPLLSCGSVMKTEQASAFGFANSLVGLAGFAVVTTIGMMLLAGVDAGKVKRWFWLGLQAGTIFGVGFITWLQYQSIFTIGALCPYCMVVWVVMIPIFVYTTLYNLRTGVIATPASLKRVVDFLQRHHGDILVLWFGIIILVILNHFWYYWKTLI